MSITGQKSERATDLLLDYVATSGVDLPQADRLFKSDLPALLSGEYKDRATLSFSLVIHKSPADQDERGPGISRIYEVVETFCKHLVSVLEAQGCKDVGIDGNCVIAKSSKQSAIQIRHSSPIGRKTIEFKAQLRPIAMTFPRHFDDKNDNIDSTADPKVKDKAASDLGLESLFDLVFDRLQIPRPFRDEFLESILEEATAVKQRAETFLIAQAYGTLDQTNSIAPNFTASAQPLCLPEGETQKYQGKKASGDIYAFLKAAYQFREGGEPLTLAWLRQNDERALTAFRNQRKIEVPPPELLVLTDPERGTKMRTLLAQHGLDLSTPEGLADAKRVMGAISSLAYRRELS